MHALACSISMGCDSFPPVDLDVELVASRESKEEVMAVPSQKKKGWPGCHFVSSLPNHQKIMGIF